jgi:hypothetical protein
VDLTGFRRTADPRDPLRSTKAARNRRGARAATLARRLLHVLLAEDVMKKLFAMGCGVALVTGTVAVGCSSTDDTGQSSDDIVRQTAIARAEEWVNAKLHYCQSPNHHYNPDQACAPNDYPDCNRENDKAWDPYRSDCSGLVSWAWDLPAPGRTTWMFAPADTSVSHSIPATDLEAGDAVNIPSEHIILFKSWVTHGKRATFIEEPGCSGSIKWAHEFTSDVSINGTKIYVAYEGRTFDAIRYNSIQNKCTSVPTAKNPAACGKIMAGEGLQEGESQKSCDGRFVLTMQTDGNLVLRWHNGGGVLWASGTGSSPAHEVLMQGDGNLVVYDHCHDAFWSSHTGGQSGAHAVVQDDGNLVVYDNGKAIWSSHTGGH